MKLLFYVLVGCLLFFVSTSACKHKPGSFTEKDVLQQLDSAFNSINKEFTYEDYKAHEGDKSDITYTFFLDLEHGYCETAGSRIHLYADSTRWAIVFEKSGYETRGGDAEIELDYYGNCYTPTVEKYEGRTTFSNMGIVSIISGDEYERVRNKVGTSDETFEFISPDAKEITVRDKKVPIAHDAVAYAKLGIQLNAADNPKHLISYGNIVRYLDDTNPALINATDHEIRQMIPADLPELMVIDQFYFESIYNKKNLPSKNETYQLIAKILAKRDTSLWKPKLKPNNHWSNWESGNL